MSTFEISKNEKPVSVTQIARIGDWAKKNQGDIAIVVGFVLVAIISFGVGYLTAPGQTKKPIVIENSNNLSASAGDVLVNIVEDTNNTSKTVKKQGSEKGLLVASKNGTKYYWPWSSWAKRIKPENEVWFNSEAEAQKAGYSKSVDFDQNAPAGYKK